MAEPTYETFVESHRMQLIFSGVPELFWPRLFEKIKHEVLDAGDYFLMVCDDDVSMIESTFGDGEEVFSRRIDSSCCLEEMSPTEKDNVQEKPRSDRRPSYIGQPFSQRYKVVAAKDEGISPNDPNCIFLIDHAWTYRQSDARRHLTQMEGLVRRMCNLMDIETDGRIMDHLVEDVLKQMWKFNQTYSIQSSELSTEEKMPVWYIMDEFGSRIGHHDSPNVRMVPFCNLHNGVSYTLMFPMSEIACGDNIYRDYVEGALYHRPDWRNLYLLPWMPQDFCSIAHNFVIPEDAFFKEGRNDDALLSEPIPMPEWSLQPDRKLKVYSEYDKVRKFLTHPNFEVVDTNVADVLWLHEHFKDYKNLISQHPHVMINQIPFESVLTVKDLLAAIVHAHYHDKSKSQTDPLAVQPSWLAATFNLRTELPQFISYFQQREKLDLDNHWIIKPFNLARGLDMTVSNDLAHIIRLIGSGPKIACKYIEDPVLFYRDDIDAWVKFDLRFIILLRSVKPLELYVYDRFWLRFGLKAFSLDDLDDYEKHFTVFNYVDKDKIKQMKCNDFMDEFEQQYPQAKWEIVQKRIYEAMKEVVQIACQNPPPRGMAPYPQCRAMYGVDVMLRWGQDNQGEKVIEPVILEVNFMPDCARACDYYPDFFNTVFETLFSPKVSSSLPVTLL